MTDGVRSKLTDGEGKGFLSTADSDATDDISSFSDSESGQSASSRESSGVKDMQRLYDMFYTKPNVRSLYPQEGEAGHRRGAQPRSETQRLGLKKGEKLPWPSLHQTTPDQQSESADQQSESAVQRLIRQFQNCLMFKNK